MKKTPFSNTVFGVALVAVAALCVQAGAAAATDEARGAPAAKAMPAEKGKDASAAKPADEAAGRERPSSVVSVLDFGAVGDGVADDTAAIQRALNDTTAEVVFPAGTYRITKTLFLGLPRPTNAYSYRRHFRGEGVDRSVLAWDGEPGGTLLWTRSMNHCKFTALTFHGMTDGKLREQRAARIAWDDMARADALIQFEFTGGGNMLNHFHSCRFAYAGAGLKFGTSENQSTNSDILFSNILAHNLKTFFWTTNNQAVDFTFEFLFAHDVGTLLRFERGGNLLVNSVQATDVGVLLQIEGGGRNCATFTLNNARLEGSCGGARNRYQLLKASNIRWEQAIVNFTGFDDVLWAWQGSKGERRALPLCEIGPGVHVAFQSSSFEGPVASVNGIEGKPASLIIRESTFGFLNPHEAVSANEFGRFKIVDSFTDHMELYPDVVKWPAPPRMTIPMQRRHEAVIPEPMSVDQALEANLSRRATWIESLKKQPQQGDVK